MLRLGIGGYLGRNPWLKQSLNTFSQDETGGIAVRWPRWRLNRNKDNTHMDKRALKILLDTFWSPSGWKPERLRTLRPEDFAYAKSKGMMFDPVRLDHHQALNDLTRVIRKLDRRTVVDAFLASLSTRRLDWRSALGSYAVFQHLPLHVPASANGRCSTCGMYLNSIEEDLNLINFERHKWGGVRHDHIGYALLDLKLFLTCDVPAPTQEDFRIFKSIMSSIAAAPPETTSANLQQHFGKAIKANKAERDVIIAILGFCGVLGTPAHPGFTHSFVSVSERALPDRRFVDMPYPACWWLSCVGVNTARLNEYFGHAL